MDRGEACVFDEGLVLFRGFFSFIFRFVGFFVRKIIRVTFRVFSGYKIFEGFLFSLILSGLVILLVGESRW